MDESTNKLFSCEKSTGVCAPTEDSGIEEIELKQQEKVTLLYYTDPICSACWAIEPQLKKFHLEYGKYVNIEYKMGGLLPGWEGFNDSGNGISQPSDVAHHWDEVGQYTGMSIDGDVWLEDPLDSSFPPSIAFKAAQQQGNEFALRFLRKIREYVFLERKNITKEEFLLQAVKECGGDQTQFLTDYNLPTIEQEFHAEMQEGRSFGVTGFPTFIFIGKEGNGFKMSGMSGYDNYILALQQSYGQNITAQPINFTELELLEKYHYLSTKEISFILSQDDSTTITNLENLVSTSDIVRETQKFGDFWRIETIAD